MGIVEGWCLNRKESFSSLLNSNIYFSMADFCVCAYVFFFYVSDFEGNIPSNYLDHVPFPTLSMLFKIGENGKV